MKRCSRCKQILDESAFPKHAGQKDGLNAACKECKNSARRKGPKPFVPDEKMRSRYRKVRVNGIQMPLHRHIVEQYLGRPLRADEAVHHINGNRYDNRLENLQVMDRCEHSRLENLGREHSEETKRRVSLSLMGNQRRKGIPTPYEMRAYLSITSTIARRRKFWSTKK